MSHKLTSKQLKAIYMLACGANQVEVARQLMMRRETLSRWKKIPEFEKRLHDVAAEVEKGMHHRLTALADASISRLKTELATTCGDPKRIQTAINILKLLGIGHQPSQNAPESEG